MRDALLFAPKRLPEATLALEGAISGQPNVVTTEIVFRQIGNQKLSHDLMSL